MAADERNREMPHTVILEGREKLSISGVVDVQSFDEDDSVQPRGGFFSRLFGG